MPWKAIPYENQSVRDAVGDVFDVSGIPRLIMLDMENGTPSVIRDNAKGPCDADTNLDEFPWIKPAMSDLSKDFEGIDELASILLLQNAEAEDSRAARSEYLMEIALEQQALDKNRKYNCFTGNQSCSILTRIRSLTGVQSSSMVLLDLGDGGAYYKADLPNSVEDIRTFVQGYESKTLQRQQCRR